MRAAAILFLSLLLSCPTVFADDAALAFNGQGPGDTPAFHVIDRWEVQWTGTGCSVTIEDQAGNVLAGSSSTGPGSIFVLHGGNYKLHVGADASVSWKLSIVAVGAPGTVAPAGGSPYYSPPDMVTASPGGAAPPSTPVTTNVTLNRTSVPPAAPPGTPGNLTDAEAAAVVLIKGDKAEGTGFLVKTADGPVVVTNQHVLAANPHIRITTSSGETIKQLGLQGASDRDLAMISIQDHNYSYLELATDLENTLQTGDQVVTPGNSEGGEVMLDTKGTVLALGPQRVEISNPVYHGNSGGPVVLVKTGKVIGVVTEAMKVETDDEVDKASFANRNSAISGAMRYFALRLDSVPRWEPYTWLRFNNETTFLSQFHERSKCLDSYINAPHNNTPEGLYYMRDDKIKEANDEMSDILPGVDSQKVEMLRNLLFNLDAVADTDLTDIQNPSNFYGYDQVLAKGESDYRVALKKELDEIKSDVNRLGSLARRTN